MQYQRLQRLPDVPGAWAIDGIRVRDRDEVWARFPSTKEIRAILRVYGHGDGDHVAVPVLIYGFRVEVEVNGTTDIEFRWR